MTNNRRELEKVTMIVPPEIMDILGPPPILPSEDPGAYNQALEQLANVVRPDNLIAWYLIRDVIDLRHEISRYRRLRAGLVGTAGRRLTDQQVANWEQKRDDNRESIRENIVAEANNIAKEKKLTGAELDAFKAETDRRIEEEIKKSDIDHNRQIEFWHPEAAAEFGILETFAKWTGPYELLDRWIRSTEDRFYRAVRELEDHLRGFGITLKGNLGKLIDVEPTADALPTGSSKQIGRSDAQDTDCDLDLERVGRGHTASEAPAAQ
jgi:hypothetical protein